MKIEEALTSWYINHKGTAGDLQKLINVVEDFITKEINKNTDGQWTDRDNLMESLFGEKE